jgi:hypothetical protein
MNRYIINEELPVWETVLQKQQQPKPVYATMASHRTPATLQSKIQIDNEPVNEVILYPMRTWNKSDYNIN